MKPASLLLLLAAFGGVLALAGCDEETHADPKLVEARDAQRRAMDPSKRGGRPTAPPTSAPGAPTPNSPAPGAGR